jgi:hypothetical protein
MIQKLIVLLIVPVFLFSFSDDKKYLGLTKDEIKFVKNVERIETEELVSINKLTKYFILLEFGSIKYLLDTRTGFVNNVWILSDDDITWEEMGPEY